MSRSEKSAKPTGNVLNADIGRRVRLLREEVGLTTTDVERLTSTGVRAGHLSNLERDLQMWQAHHLEAVGRALRLPARDLLPDGVFARFTWPELAKALNQLLEYQHLRPLVSARIIITEGDIIELTADPVVASAYDVVGFAGRPRDIYEDVHTARRNLGHGSEVLCSLGAFVVALVDHHPIPGWSARDDARTDLWWITRVDEGADVQSDAVDHESALLSAVRARDWPAALRALAHLADK